MTPKSTNSSLHHFEAIYRQLWYTINVFQIVPMYYCIWHPSVFHVFQFFGYYDLILGLKWGFRSYISCISANIQAHEGCFSLQMLLPCYHVTLYHFLRFQLYAEVEIICTCPISGEYNWFWAQIRG